MPNGKNDLSFWGNILPQVFALLTSATAFVVFVPKLLNYTSTYFGLSFTTSFYLFVIVYFLGIVCIIVIITLLYSPTASKAIRWLLDGAKNKPLPETTATIILLILLVVTPLVLFTGNFVIYFLPAAALAIILQVILFFVYSPRENNSLTKIKAEYIFWLCLVVIPACSLYHNIYNKEHAKQFDHTTFGNFNEYTQIVDSFIPAATRLNAQISIQNNEANNLHNLKDFPSRYADSLNNYNTLRDSILVKAVAGIFSGLIKPNKGDSDRIAFKKERKSIDSVHQALNKEMSRQLDNFDSIAKRPLTSRQDSLTYITQKYRTSKLYDLSNLTLEATTSLANISKTNLTKKWLHETCKIQLKGLAVLLLWTVSLLTIIFLYRQFEVVARNKLEREYQEVHDIPDTAIYQHFRKRRDLDIATPTEQTIDALNKEGNIFKTILYIAILLIIPFFKTFTEKDIDLNRPFLNLSLSNLFNGRHEEKHNHAPDTLRVYPVGLIRDSTIIRDTVRYIVDSSFKDQLSKLIKKTEAIGQSIRNPNLRRKATK